jgi:glycosyltransferase involved in cell wall biosynthesis
MSPAISLIISVYTNTRFLELVLLSTLKQSDNDFEIIVAEDGESSKMREFIETFQLKYSVKLKHITQEDNGFQKCKILNKAILSSSGDYIVIIDGDCLLHKHFVRAYKKFKKKCVCHTGRRIELENKTTDSLLKNKNLSILNFFRLLLNRDKAVEECVYLGVPNVRKASGLVGCNIGFYKEDAIRINGFDEDYTKATFGEDSDLEWRMKAAGIKIESLKNVAIQYHIKHGRPNRDEDIEYNRVIFESKKRYGLWFCKNGITKN